MHSTHHTFLSTLASIILYLADTVTAMHMLYLYSLTDPDYNKNNGTKAHLPELESQLVCALRAVTCFCVCIRMRSVLTTHWAPL
jgi:hypothetical protein